MVLLLSLLGQSVKRNAIDIKNEDMANQIRSLLQKSNQQVISKQVRHEIEQALLVFKKAQANGQGIVPYEIQNPEYARFAENGLAELFQTKNTDAVPFQSRKDLFTERIQAELINAYVPREASDLKRYFQALPNTQLFGA